MEKQKTIYFPIVLTGFALGAATTMLYRHNIWAFAGFGLAALGMILLHFHVRFIQKLLWANHTMAQSMHSLLHDLQANGIEVTTVEVNGDADFMVAGLVKREQMH